jgi:hypothetical protein
METALDILKHETSLDSLEEKEYQALRRLIRETLFTPEYNKRDHWLETILHLLLIEKKDKDLMRDILWNLAGSPPGVFKRTYGALIDKETDSRLSKDFLEDLQKIRKSMLKHLSGWTPGEYRDKLIYCMMLEPNLEVCEKMAERVLELQISHDLVLPDSAWLKFETICNHPGDFKIPRDSQFVTLARKALRNNRLLQNKGKASCIIRNAPQLQNV